MPGLPLVVRETICSHSRTVDQMCRQDSHVNLSAEEAIAAEESLSIYCKPVELYNILQRRALHNPSFLQRCLHYKIHAKRKKRIQMTVSLSVSTNDGDQANNVLPLYVLLAKPVSHIAAAEQHSAVYRLRRACLLTAFGEFGRKDHSEATFIVPEIKKLSANTKASNLTILLVSYGERRNCSGENDLAKDGADLASFPSKSEGHCLWGWLAMESLYSSWEKCATLSLGHRAELLSTIDMQSGFLEPYRSDDENCIIFQISPDQGVRTSRQVQMSILAQEVGPMEKSPYDSYMYDDVPTSSLSHIIRLRTGNVIFNYRYYNNTLQKTEVTEDFSCPFCLVQSASFKGLRCHLIACHDLFNFEFWVTEEYQAVNVSVKTDVWRSEIVADGVDPRLQTFFFCSRPRKRRRSRNPTQIAKHVHPHALDSPEAAREGFHEVYMARNVGTSSCHVPNAMPSKEAGPSNEMPLQRYENDVGSSREEEKTSKSNSRENHCQSERHISVNYGPENPCSVVCTEPVASSSNIPGACVATAQASASNECSVPVAGNNLTPPAMFQFAKTRKLSVERADPRNRANLQKRQFFHSHRAKPMAVEQVLSDRDSEDEVDDDVADFEDRRMLDDFVDVTKDEKQMMHLWNSFVRKQRVLADGHIPWACEAFSRLHGRDLVRAPALIWCWRLFMIKLWNHSLLDARTMNNCNLILESFRKESLDPK